METRSCGSCKKELPMTNYDIRKGTESLKKSCRKCLKTIIEKRIAKNKKEEALLISYETDPNFVFKINVQSSTGCDSDQLKRYAKADVVDRYYPYLRNLRNNCRIQIRTHLRHKCYSLEWIVKSGMLDKFACYDEKVMKEIREGL